MNIEYFTTLKKDAVRTILKCNNNVEQSSDGSTTFSFDNQENDVLSKFFADNFRKIVNNEELFFNNKG